MKYLILLFCISFASAEQIDGYYCNDNAHFTSISHHVDTVGMVIITYKELFVDGDPIVCKQDNIEV